MALAISVQYFVNSRARLRVKTILNLAHVPIDSVPFHSRFHQYPKLDADRVNKETDQLLSLHVLWHHIGVTIIKQFEGMT